MVLNGKRGRTGLAVLVVVVIGGLGLLGWRLHTASASLPPRVSGAHLLFDDEFSGSSLNTSKWQTCYDWYSPQYRGCTNSGNNELEWYQASQVSVAHGSAVLTARPQGARGVAMDSVSSAPVPTAFRYVSGMLSTGKLSQNGAPKWTGTYGYYEMRAELPAGDGLWPAFWLLPVNDQWPPEIDIMEMLGNAPNNILMTYFWPTGAYPPSKDTSTYTGTNFSSGWHTYALDWQPGSLTWYVDGVARKHVSSANVPDTPMQIIVDLAVGGTLPGNPDAHTRFPQSMKIDYVRVYNVKPQPAS